MTFAKSEVGVSNHDFNLGDRIIVGGSRVSTEFVLSSRNGERITVNRQACSYK